MTSDRIAVNDFVLCARDAADEPLLLGQVLWIGEQRLLISAAEGRVIVMRDHVLASGSVAELAAFQLGRLSAAVTAEAEAPRWKQHQ